MFKKIGKAVASCIMGVVTGFVLGPFAMVGKWISMNEEFLIKDEMTDPSELLPHGGNFSPAILIIGIPIFFVVGLIYGPLRGGQLGVKCGWEKGFFSAIAKEMFTYDPFSITKEIAKDIPEGRFVSYRKFRESGIFDPLKKKEPREVDLISSASYDKTDSIILPNFFYTEKSRLKIADAGISGQRYGFEP
ncbi:MAG: hypothetical protein H0U71_07300 [Gammaproteobacteria bacterium]|nr:hypothetical protein [Gammaproteobacteria bacterium]